MILASLLGTSDISKQLRDIQSSINGEEIKIEPKISFSTSYKAITKAQSELNQMLDKGFDSNNIDAYTKALDGLSTSQQKTVVNSLNLDKAEKQELLTKLQSATATNVNTIATTQDNKATETNTIVNHKNTLSLKQRAAAMKESAKATWDSMSTGAKIGIIAAATVALVNVVKWAHEQLGTFNTDIEENTKRIEEQNKKYEENEQLLSEINGKLEENEDRIKELNSLDTLTYVEETELEKLKSANDLLNEQKATLEEMQKEISQKQIKNLEEDFYNTYESNNAKANEVHKKSWNILNWLNPSYIGDVVEAKSGDTEEEKQADTEKELYNNKVLKQLSSEGKIKDIYESISEEAINAEMRRLREMENSPTKNMDYNEAYNFIREKILRDNGFKVINDPESAQEIYDKMSKYAKDKQEFDKQIDADIEENEGSLEDTLAGYYEQLEKVEKYDPNFESDFAKGLLSKIDGLKKIIDPEKWEQEKYDNIYTSNEYEDFIVEMRQKIADGVINSDTDIFEAYGENLGQIAAEMFGENNEENRKKIAANIFRRLMEGVSGEGNFIGNFSEYFNSEGYSEQKEALLELAKAGELTPAILDTEEYNSLLGETGLLAHEAYEEIMKLVTANERLADMSSDLSSLANAYKEFKEDGFASAETIASLEKFKDLDSYDDFTYTVGSSKTSATEKQEAFNTLVTEYLNREKALGKLTEATKDYYVTQLTSMGISDAETVITRKLNSETEALALKEKFLADNGIDLTEATEDQIQKFLEENEVIDDVRYALFRLNAEENIFESNELDVSGKIESLKKLATAYGITLNSLSPLDTTDPLAKYNVHYYENMLKNAQEEIGDGYKYEYGDYIPDSDDSGSDSKSSSDETYDWIEIKIERLTEAYDKWKDKAGQAFRSVTARAKAYKEAIADSNELIELNEDAKAKYMNKANSVGLDEYYAKQVRNGSLNIKTIKDESIREKIDEYTKWYEKAKECKDAISNLKLEQKELARESIETVISKYEKLFSKLESANDRISKRIDIKEALGFSANDSDYNKMNNNIQKQIDYNDEIIIQLKDLQKTVPKNSIAWLEYQDRLDSTNASTQDLTLAMIENAKAKATLAGEKAEKKVEKLDSKDELTDAKITNATTSKRKNALIDDKADRIDKRQNAYDQAYKNSSTNFNKSSRALLNKKNKKNNKAYNNVLKKVKARVKSGKKIGQSLLDQVAKIDDNLLQACFDYNSYYDAKVSNKEIADLYRETSKQDKADLAMEKFNNIQEEYENKRASNEYSKTKLNSQISLAEEQGIRVNTSYYKGLIDAEKKNQASLIEERKKLQDSLNNSVKNGSIKEGSEEWYEAQDAINNVTNAIDESTLSVEQYNNAIRQIEWDTFDDAIESMKRLNSEADFYINLMAVNNDLVDEDTGNFTEYGNATFGLHNANYKSYLEQAKEYEEEYNDLLAKIARGEESIADENVVNRLRQLEDAQRDAKISAENELKSIIDLVEQGYQAQLNALKELIDEYKELQNAEKEAYEYEKSIAEKTKSISALQKQLAVLGGSDTEESKAQIQKLKVQLEEAQDDLKDTEYNKYLSDSQNMLDEMYGNYEEFINEKLDNTNLILGEIQNIIRSSSSDIIALLRAQNGDISDELKDALGDGSKQTNITVNKEVEAQKKANEQRKEEQRKQDEKRKQDEQRKEEEKRKQAEYEAEKRKYENSKADLENAINKVNNDINDRANQMNKLQDRHNKTSNKKEKEKLKSDITNLKKEIKELKNKKSSLQKELSSLTVPAYAKGSKRITEDQIALVAEDGSELQFDASSGVLTRLGADDMVFTNEQAQRLWELSKGNHLIEPNLVPIKMPSFDVINKSNNAGGINVSINELNLPNVTNYEEFKTQLIKDNKFEKAVQSMTIDRVNGGNSLSKFKFK